MTTQSVIQQIEDKIALDFLTPKEGQMKLLKSTLTAFEGSDFIWAYNDRNNDNHLFPLYRGFNENIIKTHADGSYCYLIKSGMLIPVTYDVARDHSSKLPFEPEKVDSLSELATKIRNVLEYGNRTGCWAPANSIDRDYSSAKSWLEYFLLRQNTTMVEMMRKVINRATLLEKMEAAV